MYTIEVKVVEQATGAKLSGIEVRNVSFSEIASPEALMPDPQLVVAALVRRLAKL